MLCVVAVGLAFLRTVDAAEADTLRAGVVQNFDGVAVKDGDDEAGTITRWVRRNGEPSRDHH